MTRFLHSADWQLGMTRRFLGDEAQAHYTRARFDAIQSIGRVAKERGCEFLVVCGDVFETNQVDRKTVARALEALGTIEVPVYLLPGNHDPLDAGSIYRQPTFAHRKPAHVHVLESSAPVRVAADVELVGAPWTSKRPLADLVQRACAELEPSDVVARVCVAHGAIDQLSPDRDDPSRISLEGVERLIAERRIHYLALGDRHSRTSVGGTGRIHYSGTPEPTDYDETEPGFVLVVDTSTSPPSIEPVAIGTWRFERRAYDLNGEPDLDALQQSLGETQDKERVVLKLDLVGTLTLRQKSRLDRILDSHADLFAAIEISHSRTELAVAPEESDFGELGLTGFAARALERLRAQSGGAGPEAAVVRDALGLLLRLTERGA